MLILIKFFFICHFLTVKLILNRKALCVWGQSIDKLFYKLFNHEVLLLFLLTTLIVFNHRQVQIDQNLGEKVIVRKWRNDTNCFRDPNMLLFNTFSRLSDVCWNRSCLKKQVAHFFIFCFNWDQLFVNLLIEITLLTFLWSFDVIWLNLSSSEYLLLRVPKIWRCKLRLFSSEI